MVPLLLSCNSVPLKDEIFYGNKGMVGAVEFHTLVDTKRDISFEEWMSMIRTTPLICESVDTFGDIKTFVEQACSICNCCSPDTTAKAEEFFKNVQAFDKMR